MSKAFLKSKTAAAVRLPWSNALQILEVKCKRARHNNPITKQNMLLFMFMSFNVDTLIQFMHHSTIYTTGYCTKGFFSDKSTITQKLQMKSIRYYSTKQEHKEDEMKESLTLVVNEMSYVPVNK